MSESGKQTQKQNLSNSGQIIKLAIMAVGGQGGGVLTNWIETLARTQGYVCQATSVAGVAQRTGATIYYIEMAPLTKKLPIFSLAPAAGDVDLLIAAEWMEAGRAIQRGFVTPDRTTLIASTHRALAMSEKMRPGDGISDPTGVQSAAELMSDRLISFDMDALAAQHGSVVSATLFGALAASGKLPFTKSAFEDAIRIGNKGVEASLSAFQSAYEQTNASVRLELVDRTAPENEGYSERTQSKSTAEFEKLNAQVSTLPESVRCMAKAGLHKTIDFMDCDYGAEYLDRVAVFAALDSERLQFDLTTEAAKHIANAMAYDDVIRVADLKTRAARVVRIAGEMGAEEEQLLRITDFLRPRVEEIVGIMPSGIGGRLSRSPRALSLLGHLFSKGRRLRIDRFLPFLLLHLLGGLQRYRRHTYRHTIEQEHLNRWLALAAETAQTDYALGVEVLRCRRLIKGYSDTHARGLTKFDKVIGALPLLAGRRDAAEWVRRLREAALQDEAGTALEGAIRTIGSFSKTQSMRGHPYLISEK
ncbi:indolepyruvate oxidoreductase subunit beta family protein [Aliiroseovarius sp. 2305UL8-7]|uniref:indolepyruvate oxidoreductase subunit beta family protein n=1 Tax=Aliiroseovarius conchicola TaxID=3121637 RepID=UPI003527053B